MTLNRVDQIAAPSRVDVKRLSRRVVCAFLAVGLLACIVAAALLLLSAEAERRSIRERALRSAIALSFGFDQEVAAVNYLLKGLATSPALAAGDIQTFHKQMLAAQVPKGSWLLLQDLNGQVANTLRPFGQPLPSAKEMQNYDALIARLKERPWTVSGRVKSAINDGYVVGLSFRLDSADGELKRWLTAILAQARLNEILDQERVPVGWKKVLYDRSYAPVVTSDRDRDALSLDAPVELRTALTREAEQSSEGFVESLDQHGIPVLVAYRRSDATNWIATVSTSLAQVNAPLTSAVRGLAASGLLLLAVAAACAMITTRQVETPIKSLSGRIESAESEIAELSKQLLSLQEEERRRIARELHDSTVQRLVATSLGLAGLATGDATPAEARRRVIADEIRLALNELRVFAYLLHPPDLAAKGLAKTLQDYVTGFCKRAQLRLNLTMSGHLDRASLQVQLTALRVVQEALSNVHRHANATRVDVAVRTFGGKLFLRIRDDGAGLHSAEFLQEAPLGVGIPGMRARLQQFHGRLKIRSGASGTIILATLPLREATIRD